MASLTDPGRPASTTSFPLVPVIAVAGAIAMVLAVSIAAQTYLSMIRHGHSFARMLAWQMTTWGFWAVAAPFVLRWGAGFAHRPRSGRAALRLVALGVFLLAMHSAIATPLTLLIQPFAPIATDSFSDDWLAQVSTRFAADSLVYGLLILLGAALWAHRHAQDLEVRQSRLETELARAQLHALRLEIEPHFLFNTLNAITALVRLKDNRRAVDMLVDLGDFMRSNLDGPRDQFATLGTEIEWVRRYISLQHARFADRLDVDYRVDEDGLGCRVPTLLLLPVVENAFRHGLSRSAGRGRLVVEASRQSEALTITIADNGAGVAPGFDVDRQAGTGLRNVRDRLLHLYGHAATLDIHRGDPEGTVVTIRIPLRPPWHAQATA